jgi:hypothetical protein
MPQPGKKRGRKRWPDARRKTPPSRARSRPRIPAASAGRIASESRALLVASMARGRRWLDELLADANANAESIAKRERCSVRKVNMTISLAFLAPDLVKAAIAGQLPYGMGVARLADMPAEWSRQHQMLGFLRRNRHSKPSLCLSRSWSLRLREAAAGLTNFLPM